MLPEASTVPPPLNIAMQKKILRERAIALRTSLSAHQRAEAENRIASALDRLLEMHSVHCIGFCWPHRGEPDLRGWIRRWLDGDPLRTAALPVVVAPRRAMVFRRWTAETEMVPDRYGIPHPAHGEVLHPDLVLVPVNAFDGRGYRIGYGGGYFDRTLAAQDPRPISVGVGFESARVDDALAEAHDLPMQWAVTEAGLERFAAVPSARGDHDR